MLSGERRSFPRRSKFTMAQVWKDLGHLAKVLLMGRWGPQEGLSPEDAAP